ncbi:MAG: hypothetical protein PHU25_09565 [Deltaproteobacteria bacterium]|nr:hypothetical protein [Deltaproteobacteria bacterium]
MNPKKVKRAAGMEALRAVASMLLCVIVTSSWSACYKAGKPGEVDTDTASGTDSDSDSDGDSESDSGESTDTGTGTPHQGQHLRAIMGTGPDDIYAAGTCGLLLHFDGKEWTEIDLGADNTFNTVWAVAKENVLVGGAVYDECNSEGACGQGIIYRFDGMIWQRGFERTEDCSAIVSIWGASSDNIYAVGGYSSDSQSDISHFDGSSWSTLSSSGMDQVCYLGSGHRWSDIPQAIWGFASAEIYIYAEYCGADEIISTLYYFPHIFDKTCSIIDVASGYSHGRGIGSIWGSSPEDVFAVRDTGPAVYRYDGTAWSEMETGGAEELMSIWGLGPKDVYAVGLKGRIIHYDGDSWKSMKTGIAGDLRGVWGTKEAIYAVGDDNAKLPDEERSPAIYRYDGQSWTRVY